MKPRAMLEQLIRKHDIIIPNVALYDQVPSEATKDREPHEWIIRHRLTKPGSCIYFSTEHGTIPVLREATKDGDYVYPEIAMFTATREPYMEEDIEEELEELAIDIVRQKEEAFFKLLHTHAEAHDLYQKHESETLGCAACRKLVPSNPIGWGRANLQGSARAIYVDAGGLRYLLADKSIMAWFSPSETRDEMQAGRIGMILGLPIYTNAFRDEVSVAEKFLQWMDNPLEYQDDVLGKAKVVVCGKGVKHTLPTPCTELLISENKIVAEHRVALLTMGRSVAFVEHCPEGPK